MPQVSGYNVQWCGTHTRFVDEPLVEPEPVVEPESECAVCFQAIGNTNCCTTACGHKFCLECLIKHSKGNTAAKCPLCRQGVTPAPPPPPPPPQQQVQAQVLGSLSEAAMLLPTHWTHNQQQLYNLLIALRVRDRWIQGPGGLPEYQWR